SVALIPSAVAARGSVGQLVAAGLGGALIMKAAVKIVVAVVVLALLLWGGLRLARSPSEVTRARPGAAWRMPGGVGAGSARVTVEVGTVPAWFGQRGASVRRIAGRVTFAGNPVSGAAVELGSELTDAGLMPRPTRRTGADGAFDFGTQPPAKFSVAAS